jgi:hypothetical protein
MMAAKNTNQKVNTIQYGSEIERIFGPRSDGCTSWSGVYKYDEKLGRVIQIPKRIGIISHKLDPVTESIRNVEPITIRKRRV